jgi:hypothetical protein
MRVNVRGVVCVMHVFCLLVDVAALSELELTDATGAPRRLGDYWAERPVILVFLRHFG